MNTTWTATTETLDMAPGTLVHIVTGTRTSTTPLGTTELATIACEPTFPALATTVQPAGTSYPEFRAPCPACTAATEPTFTLTYVTDGHRHVKHSLTRFGVERLGTTVMHVANRGLRTVTDIAVHDTTGGDVTFDFACFRA